MPNFSGVWNLKEQIQAIAAGRWTGLPEFDLYAWGGNINGHLGDLTYFSKSSPVQVGTEVSWYQVAVSSQDSSSAGLSSDHALWTWGQNTKGQLGDGTVVAKLSPVQVGPDLNWDSVSCGGEHVAAIKTDGTLWTWGYGQQGQLGQSSIISFSSPVQVGALTSWSSVSAAGAGCLALKTDGTLWSWGIGNNGRLGTGNTQDKSSPTQIGALTTWAKVANGSSHAAAIKTDDTLWMWGTNGDGQLGQGNRTLRSSPVQVGVSEWAEVSAGGGSTLAVKTNGTLWAWGDKTSGQIGDDAVVDRSTPTQIGVLTNWLKPQVGSTNNFNGCLRTDGTLWAWGRNTEGQLGSGDTIEHSSPIQVGALTNWSSLSGGQRSFLATAEGTTN